MERYVVRSGDMGNEKGGRQKRPNTILGSILNNPPVSLGENWTTNLTAEIKKYEITNTS